MFNVEDIENMLREATRMKDFDHPNVLSLIGVSLPDSGQPPYIVMPFMASGSLVNYLRNQRPDLTIAEGASYELVRNERFQDTSVAQSES